MAINPAQFSTPMGRHMRQGRNTEHPNKARSQPKPVAIKGLQLPSANVLTPSTSPAPAAAPQMRSSAQPAGGGGNSATSSMPQSQMEVLQQIMQTPGTPDFKANQDPKSLFIQAMNQANAANDTRYKQAIGLQVGQGQSARFDAQRQHDEGLGGDTQSLISRGLFNTTVLDSATRRRDEELQRANQSIGEGVATNTANIVQGRTDQAPDMGQYANLLQQQAGATAQNTAQNQKTSQTIFGPRGPNSFVASANAGGGGGGGASGGAGTGPGGAPDLAGGGGAGAAPGGKRVNTFTNPAGTRAPVRVQPRNSFWGAGSSYGRPGSF